MTVWLKPVPHDWHSILESHPGLHIWFSCGLRVDYVTDAPTATNPPPLGRCHDCARIVGVPL